MRPETEAAIGAITAAVKIADSRRGADETESKGGIDLVTATDVVCEDAIRLDLLGSFPDYPVIGEERGGTPRNGDPYWLVDPICGTRMFASNLPLYCTNIALVEDGEITLAAVGVGRTDEILFAEKGSGSWMRTGSGDRRIAASEDSKTIWVEPRPGFAPAVGVIDRLFSTRRWYVLVFPSAVSWAYLASGRISGIVDVRTPAVVSHGSVHTAAGCFIASESGAVVTDLESNAPWNLNTRSFLVGATPSLHQELDELVGELVRT